MDISEKDLVAKMAEISVAFETGLVPCANDTFMNPATNEPPSVALLRSLARLELVTERLCERLEGMRGVSGERALGGTNPEVD